MTKHGKKFIDAHAPLRPRAAVPADRGARPGEVVGHPQVRRDGRGGVPPRRRPPQGRPDDPRHGVAAATAPARACASPCSPRVTRPARPRRPAPTSSAPTTSSRGSRSGFLDFDVAIATPDLMAPGRQARPHARPARPDAEPEDRHGHATTSARRSASSRPARSSTAPTATATCTCRSARRASTADALLENYHAVLDELLRAKPASSKGRYLKAVTRVVDAWAPACKIDPTVTRVDEHASPASRS